MSSNLSDLNSPAPSTSTVNLSIASPSGNSQCSEQDAPSSNYEVGIFLGIKHLYVLAKGPFLHFIVVTNAILDEL